MPANFDAWRVYQATQGQLIMSFGGPVAVNHMAVWKYLEKYEIENQIETFEKVITLSSRMISDQNEESRLEREANKVK